MHWQTWIHLSESCQYSSAIGQMAMESWSCIPGVVGNFMPKMMCECVYRAQFFYFCVWHSEDLLEVRGGSSRRGMGSGWKPDDVAETASDWLGLGSSFRCWPTLSGNPVIFQSLKLSNVETVLCFLDSTMQNSRIKVNCKVLGQLAQHDNVRIFINTIHMMSSILLSLTAHMPWV
jgi:hypothetical protein